jgi:hypothetical protein
MTNYRKYRDVGHYPSVLAWLHSADANKREALYLEEQASPVFMTSHNVTFNRINRTLIICFIK